MRSSVTVTKNRKLKIPNFKHDGNSASECKQTDFRIGKMNEMPLSEYFEWDGTHVENDNIIRGLDKT